MIYLYETIPASDLDQPTRFEIKQSIHEKALDKHPETGEPVRRVIVGGIGLITSKSATPEPRTAPPARTGGGCGGGCACH